MKKIITIGIAFCLLAFTPLINKTAEPRKYKFEFNEIQVNAIWNIIDNSTAPHDQVKAVQALINDQLKAQMVIPTDSTKKEVPLQKKK